MKFWQLSSIVHSYRHVINEVATTQDEWKFISDWLSNYDKLVEIQDRSKLDYQLPDHFIREVLKNVNLPYYISHDAIWLRSWKALDDDSLITALDAFDRYGANAMEEAIEFGSFKVKK